MAHKEVISTPGAPQPRAPISQAVRFGNLVFVSGTAGRKPEDRSFPEGGIREQTDQLFKNIQAVLEEAGTSLDSVLKVNCYLKDRGDFEGFNEVFAEYFPKDYPARTTFQAGALGEGMLVEVEAIAGIPD